LCLFGLHKMDRILSLKDNLCAAVENEDHTKALQLLEQLESEQITLAVLQETKVGVTVGKLRKHSDSRLAQASAKIVAKWKTVVPPPLTSATPTKTDTNKTTSCTIATNTKAEPPTPTPSPSKTTHSTVISDAQRKRSSPPIESVESPSSKRPKLQHAEKPERKASPPLNSGYPPDPRMKIRETLAAQLEPTGEGERDAQKLAAEIEQEVFNMFGDTDKAYYAKCRQLRFNLGHKTRELRNRVMCGEVTPARLCQMTVEELAPKVLQDQRAKIREEQKRNIQPTNPEDLAESDQYECKKCGKRMTKLRQLQTRGADEPMTTFVTCLACGNHWRF